MPFERPKFERDEPTISPALLRRRDQLLGPETARREEPQLIAPTADVAEEIDADPDIPPMPSAEWDIVEPALTVASRRRARRWPVAAALAVVVAMGAGAWVVYDRVAVAPAAGELPYVTAEAGPEKIRPENEGGLDVPNQDIRIYNELNGMPDAVEPEVLLPPPETPMAPPSTAEAAPPAAPDASDIPVVAAPELSMEPAAGTDAETAAATGAGTAAETDAAPAVEATEAPPRTAATTGSFRIQLAAVKDADAAKASWKKLTKAHPDVLGGLQLKLVKVERGGSTLYRIQGGMLADRAAAEKACGKLKQKNQDCLVIAP